MKLKKFFSMAAIGLTAAAMLTNCSACDDILGEWDRPTPVAPTSSDPAGDDADPMLTTALTFEAKEAGAVVTLKIYNTSFDITQKIYKKEGDGDWTEYTIGDPVMLASAGDKVSFWSNNQRLATDQYHNLHFTTTAAQCYVYGNVMSLIDDQATSVSDQKFSGDKTIGADYALNGLFNNNANIVNHGEKKLLLPATELKNDCYNAMFNICTALTAAPALPATTLKDN